MKLGKLLLVLSSVAMLSGCVTDKYVEGTGFVKTGAKLPAKKKCQFVGNVSSQYGDKFAGQFMSTKTMQGKTLKYLKASAIKKGANFIVITKQNAQTGGMLGSTTHISMQGKAYDCR